MIKSYQNIEWAFQKNTKEFLSILYDSYEDNPYYLNNLDVFFKFLRETKCKNVQEKLMHIADFWNFTSILSELEVAELLIKKNKSVRILPDNYNDMVSPPDLQVFDDSIDAYVEVTRITNDQTIEIIIEKMNEIINHKNISFAIDVELNDEISIPAFNKERDIKKQKIDLGLKEFSELYESLGKIDESMEISTSIGVFRFRKSKFDKGYCGTFLWGSGVPYEKIIQKIRRDIIIKAEKRRKWSGDHLKKYYIIALDFEDISHDYMYLESAVFGSMTLVDIDAKLLIKEAEKRGWGEYLADMNITSSYNFLDPKNWGVFFTSEVVRNVSGVLGRFRGRKPVFYPNPFSYEDMNNTKLVNFLNEI